MGQPRLFLDADGVLADFDLEARQLLGATPKDYIARHGRGAFWKRLAKAKNFYGSLPEMPDARLLFDSVKHLEPTILTGLPLGNWAAPQKVEWAAEHFPGVPIVTCMARDKHKHMHAGDVLVDDREKHRSAYEAAGVVFVHHKNAEDTLGELAKIFPRSGLLRNCHPGLGPGPACSSAALKSRRPRLKAGGREVKPRP